jgi:hypothetical protein
MSGRMTGRASLALLAGLAFVSGGEAAVSAGGRGKFFETRVRPILEAHCLNCHGGAKKVRGGLRLTSRAEVLKGGGRGPAVSLDKPDDSLLLKAINHADEHLKMPPRRKLARGQIDVLARWVRMGLPWSGTPVARRGPPKVDEKARSFWAFRPVVRPAVPEVKASSWCRNPIDNFLLAKLESAKLKPAPPAGKVELLRRVHYDLTGLPPTPEEVDAFLKDDRPDAYERLVERLLASPAYGEKWARHWLDLVRYAESNSFERDGAKPFVWRWRDYVIDSLNSDKPYDEFVREQLAGDELDRVTPEGVIATGYYRLGIWDDEPADPAQALYDELDDIASTTGQVFLGLTVGCARCHDHKIDPFPQKDYYRLLAFFRGIRSYGVRSPESVADASLRTLDLPVRDEGGRRLRAEHARREAEVAREMKKIEDQVRPSLSGVEKEEFQYDSNRVRILKAHVPGKVSRETFRRYLSLRRQRDRLRRAPGALPQALCVKEVGPEARPTFVLPRGNPHARGEKVEPGFPSVLTSKAPSLPKPDPKRKTSGRRRVLAEWVASADNPLTARVMVNRLWQYHFGRGIVRSSSNFGYQGTPPTHPELLDWLAGEFVRRGWSLKAMHRLMVTSGAYRMASRGDAKALAQDPENDLFWRFNTRRLAAEEVRDSILAACGNLNRATVGGPSVYPVIPKEVLAGQSMPGAGWKTSVAEDRARRSVYIHLKRSLAVPLLASFDAPDPDATCPVRFTTTQPTQALGLLNSDFLHEQARVFAESLGKEPGVEARVRKALGRVLQRAPSAAEVGRGAKLVRELEDDGMRPAEALRCFCLLALNLNEFLYLD